MTDLVRLINLMDRPIPSGGGGPVVDNIELREDGTYELREDGTIELRE